MELETDINELDSIYTNLMRLAQKMSRIATKKNIGNFSLEDARLVTEVAIRMCPHLPEGYYHLSRLDELKGKLDEAMSSIQYAIELNAENPHFYLQLGIILRKKGLLFEAVNAQKAAIDLKGNFPGPYFQLSHLYNKIGDIDSALQYIRIAISLRDDNPRFYQHLGSLLKKNGAFKEAIDAQLKAISLDSKLPEPYFQLSLLYFSSGCLDSAFKMVSQAISLKKDNFLFHEHLGRVLNARGELEQARKAEKKAEVLKSEAPKHRAPIQNLNRLPPMLRSGEILVVPAGFRCYTKGLIQKALSFKQKSLPFDSGFFPPHSIASIVNDPEVHFVHEDEYLNYSVCLKKEQHKRNTRYGIKFTKSSHQEIERLISGKDKRKINACLDSTYGYYTLNHQHNFILAHYNWHRYAQTKYSQGGYSVKEIIHNINEIFSRRIDRLFSACEAAKYVFFVKGETQSYEFLEIDDTYFDLKDYTSLLSSVLSRFGKKSHILHFDTPEQFVELPNLILQKLK